METRVVAGGEGPSDLVGEAAVGADEAAVGLLTNGEFTLRRTAPKGFEAGGDDADDGRAMVPLDDASEAADAEDGAGVVDVGPATDVGAAALLTITGALYIDISQWEATSHTIKRGVEQAQEASQTSALRIDTIPTVNHH